MEEKIKEKGLNEGDQIKAERIEEIQVEQLRKQSKQVLREERVEDV